MTVHAHEHETQLRPDVSATCACLTLSGEIRVSRNLHGGDGCDGSTAKSRLLALPCAVLQHILSLCDACTVCCPPSTRWPACPHTACANGDSWARSTACAWPSTARPRARRARSLRLPCATRHSHGMDQGGHGCWCVSKQPPRPSLPAQASIPGERPLSPLQHMRNLRLCTHGAFCALYAFCIHRTHTSHDCTLPVLPALPAPHPLPSLLTHCDHHATCNAAPLSCSPALHALSAPHA